MTPPFVRQAIALAATHLGQQVQRCLPHDVHLPGLTQDRTAREARRPEELFHGVLAELSVGTQRMRCKQRETLVLEMAAITESLQLARASHADGPGHPGAVKRH